MELTAVAVLIAVLVFAVARPWGLPEAVAAVPAAGIVVACGLVPWHQARQEIGALAPTVGFLAAVLVLAHLADRDGVFAYAGTVAARWSRGSPRRLLVAVFAIAAVVTATLSLDATVVLLTPVVLTTTTMTTVRPRPHLYACAHLANSASLLLPVSNLTNLLAFTASGLSFVTFAGLMALPWLTVVAVEYLVFRWFFADDLATPAHRTAPQAVAAPTFALAVLGGTLVGFGLAGPLHVGPGWVATAGALVLAARQAQRLGRQTAPRLGRQTAQRLGGAVAGVIKAANPAFLVFVFGLGIVVLAVRDHGAATTIGHMVPARSSLVGLLTAAALGAVLANVLNNLPATLLLVPLVAPSQGLVLAVLLGVNLGPNLTYVGSLATLLWRQILHTHDQPPATAEFLRLGAVTTPACLAVGVAALWLGLRCSGVS
jgi:arsenical pump membrane protein